MLFHLSVHDVKLLFHRFDSYSTYTSFYSTKIPFLFHILFHVTIVLFHAPIYFSPRSWSFIPRKQVLFHKGWNYVELTSIPHNSTGCPSPRCAAWSARKSPPKAKKVWTELAKRVCHERSKGQARIMVSRVVFGSFFMQLQGDKALWFEFGCEQV